MSDHNLNLDSDEIQIVPKVIRDRAKKLAALDDPEGALELLEQNVVWSSNRSTTTCMENIDRAAKIRGRVPARVAPREEDDWEWMG